MKTEADPTDLSNLNDIVVPPDVAWWPLAMGWYLLTAVVLVCLAAFAWQRFRMWQTNAYRREALRLLASASDSREVAELLKRTTIAVLPRSTVAAKTGTGWVDWLCQQSPQPMSDMVRNALSNGLYAPATSVRADEGQEFVAVRQYAEAWVKTHRPLGDDATC